MKLPSEVRQLVIQSVVGDIREPMCKLVKVSNCPCGRIEKSAWLFQTRLSLALAQTSKAMHAEVMRYLFKRHTIDFVCACDMDQQLATNELMRDNVRSVRVYWVGRVSDSAFHRLSKCQSLRVLTVVVSRSTLNYLSKRETDLNAYFGMRRCSRLTDVLGLDEMLKIRGLEHVVVEHANIRQAERLHEEQRASLAMLLNSKLKQPRDDW